MPSCRWATCFTATGAWPQSKITAMAGWWQWQSCLRPPTQDRHHHRGVTKGGAGRRGWMSCFVHQPCAPWEAIGGYIYLLQELCMHWAGEYVPPVPQPPAPGQRPPNYVAEATPTHCQSIGDETSQGTVTEPLCPHPGKNVDNFSCSGAMQLFIHGVVHCPKLLALLLASAYSAANLITRGGRVYLIWSEGAQEGSPNGGGESKVRAGGCFTAHSARLDLGKNVSVWVCRGCKMLPCLRWK